MGEHPALRRERPALALPTAALQPTSSAISHGRCAGAVAAGARVVQDTRGEQCLDTLHSSQVATSCSSYAHHFLTHILSEPFLVLHKLNCLCPTGLLANNHFCEPTGHPSRGGVSRDWYLAANQVHLHWYAASAALLLSLPAAPVRAVLTKARSFPSPRS